jgi:hypothetical protein
MKYVFLSLGAALVMTLICTWSTALTAQSAAVTLHVIDRGAHDANVPGAEVHVLASSGAEIATGITDGSGNYLFSTRQGQSITIKYEKVGYVRRPESLNHTTAPGAQRVDGPLVKTGEPQSYYVELGRRLEELARTSPGGVQAVPADDVARVKALSQQNQDAVASALSPAFRNQIGRSSIDSSRPDRGPETKTPKGSKADDSGVLQKAGSKDAATTLPKER